MKPLSQVVRPDRGPSGRVPRPSEECRLKTFTVPCARACASCLAVLLGLVPAVLWAQQSAVPTGAVPDAGVPGRERVEPVPAVPVHQEPHHRQVFQRGPMRILDLQLPPGDISWFHSHEWPVLYVTLSQGQMRTQNLGEPWGGGGRGRGAAATAPAGAAATAGTSASVAGAPVPGAGQAAGQPGGARGAAPAAGAPTGGRRGAPAGPRPTSNTGYAERPVTHRLENTGTAMIRAVVVVNETAGNETLSEAAAGFAGQPELSNAWFRAYRIALGPGEKTPPHRHRAPVAIVQATAGTGVGAGPVSFEFNAPGQWAYFDADAPHEVRNTGDGRLDLIEVEVRRK